MAGVEIQWLGQKELKMEGQSNNPQEGIVTNAGAGNEPVGGTTLQNSTGNNPVTFDDFLKDGKNQAEFDKRVQKAIETAKGKSVKVIKTIKPGENVLKYDSIHKLYKELYTANKEAFKKLQEI